MNKIFNVMVKGNLNYHRIQKLLSLTSACYFHKKNIIYNKKEKILSIEITSYTSNIPKKVSIYQIAKSIITSSKDITEIQAKITFREINSFEISYTPEDKIPSEGETFYCEGPFTLSDDKTIQISGLWGERYGVLIKICLNEVDICFEDIYKTR